MGITIKIYDGKWRIEIENEKWEFENRKELDIGLKTLLDLKDKKGRVKK